MNEDKFDFEVEFEDDYDDLSHGYYLGSFGSFDKSLEYKRTYKSLTKNELINLINTAKKEKWIALDLSNCGLKEIPAEIGCLECLEYLKLSTDSFTNENEEEYNKLYTLPKEIGNLKNLKELSLYGVHMKNLPKEISNLKSLKFLNLNENNFETFPEEITSIESLEFLAIDNIYNEIPNSIASLRNLKYLYLPEIMINTLPDSIGELTNLEKIYLGRSKIQTLPESMTSLINLKEIIIEETPLSKKIPPEIFNQTPSQLINYILQFQREENKITLNESKMIIVGQGGVGKTTLLNKIVNDIYKESPSTEGIDIEKWKFELNAEEYILNIWDFGGQEIYHSTHQFFLTKRSLYIFVWDARQEDEYGRMDYWLNTIQSFSDDSPIIVVINKCDQVRKNIRLPDVHDLKKRFPQIVNFFEVSCLDDINIDTLKKEILHQAKNLPLMETDWFSSWAEIREELEALSEERNIINFEEYLKICLIKGIEENEAISLIKYLHDLGVVLHFHNDVLLKNIVILSPEWGTDAVYKILDAQTNVLKNRNGILFHDDLCKIWKDKSKYPQEMYPYILKLMENFQLSFTVESHSTYLIPELLGNTEQLYPIDFNRECLHFRFSYNFLPAGIMTKFIVKAHKLLLDDKGTKICWRKGAYLKYKNAICIAILKDGITERYIDIKVVGDNRRNKSELLTNVRKIFEEIHQNITKIEFTEYVQCNCSPSCEYLHDYKYLLKLEEKHFYTERCKNSFEDVNILSLLDGIELKKERNNEMVEINFKPIINNNPHIMVRAENNLTNENNITIEIKNTLHELQGNINELLSEVPDSAKEDIEKMAAAIESAEGLETKEEIKKSGALTKIKRILEDLSDPNSSTGKAINGTKYGYSILQDIADKYNSIAEWCALPTIPKFLLKK
ncbi:COR domain-containing protein [Lysinibacillus sp. FSL L8-0312]|uniref:COR domain-containing protein n=1 Tax=Lysinibacillus sp. FSL L8-0312 TaxID=2921521 RepID=UPI0030FA4EC8